jgi:hypothetical protein
LNIALREASALVYVRRADGGDRSIGNMRADRAPIKEQLS